MRRAPKQMSYKPALCVAGASVAVCAITYVSWGTYLYWNDIRVLNFLAAWIPFVLSILVAFVPEHKMSDTKKLAWRISVVSMGFVWSFVLWHQQVVTGIDAKKDETNIVEEAVRESNEHSDQQLTTVKRDVAGVKKDVGDVREYLGTKTDKLEGLVTKSETDITQGLSKVGKPDPPEKTAIMFSLWPDDPTAQVPVLQKQVSPDKDGKFTIDYTFQNTSSSPANNMDVWIEVCDECEFAEQPPGFEHLDGAPETIRHRTIGILNPGTSMPKSAIKVRTKREFSDFFIEFRYSCATCGKPQDNKQQARILVGQSGVDISAQH